jgi:hypothetical protein
MGFMSGENRALPVCITFFTSATVGKKIKAGNISQFLQENENPKREFFTILPSYSQ